ncbi:MgtC/SapB family protein [Acetivibrio mesophilus]|uniref:MgtC/SapB family protein n=1 Tax=Acetivibrio mesophilus TaxID=2487273 RepID=A0A4Q0I3U1_9FIRM|nr:MgtC/SapB family protein [Acetivibrio mesophilus]ODM26652.1 methyltransferase [Clostridium sp. Bc-iso-3]RXE58916.1 MgtC/SapB family protein [Acetivibrio mesophilus]HHV28467.1 MgtC/SapB family protein [Clostridium sp.]
MMRFFLENGSFYLIVVIRLLLACVLGGVIGYERESTNRPAGFRTHILVCVGSALVMITSQYIFERYKGVANIDPARLGAQVISGIGFLGAGTIIREGANVRGLTTAASLWAVSCVGIAAGIGFYEGAIISTVIIYITLILLKRTEKHITKKRKLSVFYIQTEDMPGQIGTIGGIFGKYNVTIRNIEFINDDIGKEVLIKFLVRIPMDVSKEKIMDELQGIYGVKKVTGQ